MPKLKGYKNPTPAPNKTKKKMVKVKPKGCMKD